MNQDAANPLLDEIEALQDQVLSELDQLNRQIESVLKVHLAAEAGEEAKSHADCNESDEILRRDLPMVVRAPYLQPTLFLPARIAS